MDVYQPNGFGWRKRRNISPGVVSSSMSISEANNATTMDYSSPLSQHWTAFADEIIIDNPKSEDDSTKPTKKLLETLSDLVRRRDASNMDLKSLPLPPETVARSHILPPISVTNPTTTTVRVPTTTSRGVGVDGNAVQSSETTLASP